MIPLSFLRGLRSFAALPLVLRSRGPALSPHPPANTFYFLLAGRSQLCTRTLSLLRTQSWAGCAAGSHKSAQRAENIEVTYQWLGNDGGTEPKIRGRSVSFSLVRIPFRWK